MLILTRKKDESIIIDDKIKITLLDIDSNRVQIGIEAPRSISIHREEVYQEIQEENRMAAIGKINISEVRSDLKKKVKKKTNKKND